MKAHELLLRHSEEWSQKYPGKCVAIVANRLVATGRDRIEAYEKAKELFPKQKKSIFYIPTKDETVPLL